MTLWSGWPYEERRDALIVLSVSRLLLALGVAGVLWLPLPSRAVAANERAWAIAAMSALALVVLLGRPWSARQGWTGVSTRVSTGSEPHWQPLAVALVISIVVLTGGIDSPMAWIVVLVACCWDTRGTERGANGRSVVVGAGASACYLLASAVALRAQATPLAMIRMCELGLALGLLTGALTRWRLALVAETVRTRELRAVMVSWRAQALALERTRGELLAHVSHELMTPLAAIQSCAGLLSDLRAPVEADLIGQGGGASAFDRMVGTIQRNTARLELSVADLLELARLEEGSPVVMCAWHACRDILTRAAEMLEPLFVSKNQRVQVAVTHSDLRIWGDARRIERVVTNLLANAHKYAGEGAGIRLLAVREPQGTRLEVSDDGPGIPEQALAHLFDRYYRAPGVPGQGSGLGLAIVQAEVGLHGGQVWAESIAEHGSRFICVFPYPSADEEKPVSAIEVTE